MSVLTVYENMGIQQWLTKAVKMYADEKYNALMSKLTATEKEDLDLMLLMLESDRSDTVDKATVFENFKK